MNVDQILADVVRTLSDSAARFRELTPIATSCDEIQANRQPQLCAEAFDGIFRSIHEVAVDHQERQIEIGTLQKDLDPSDGDLILERAADYAEANNGLLKAMIGKVTTSVSTAVLRKPEGSKVLRELGGDDYNLFYYLIDKLPSHVEALSRVADGIRDVEDKAFAAFSS